MTAQGAFGLPRSVNLRTGAGSHQAKLITMGVFCNGV